MFFNFQNENKSRLSERLLTLLVITVSTLFINDLAVFIVKINIYFIDSNVRDSFDFRQKGCIFQYPIDIIEN